MEDEMIKFEKPYEGQIYQGCLNCPPVEKIAPMDMLIAVGFGMAQVTKDDDVVFSEQPNDEEYHALSEFEAMAKDDPDHDWRVALEAPLRSREYQRQGDDKWVLINSGMGFA
jgi:hypothetical protein